MSDNIPTFHVLIFNDADGTTQRAAVTTDPARAVQVQAAALRICGAPPAVYERGAGNSRPIVVIGLSDTRMDGAAALQVGDEFPSAREMDVALGFNYPAISQAFSKAKGRPPEEGVELRGVRIQYKDVWDKYQEQLAVENTNVD